MNRRTTLAVAISALAASPGSPKGPPTRTTPPTATSVMARRPTLSSCGPTAAHEETLMPQITVLRSRSFVATVVTLLLVGGGTAAASPPPEDAVALPVAEVTLDDFSITMPDTLPAGAVRVEATNVGAEDHEVSFARVVDGATVADVAAADQQSDSAADALLDFYGGATEVRPGATETVEVDLPAGTYLVLDLIPSSDGTPHVDLGMVKVVTVGDAAGTSATSNSVAATELLVDDVDATIELFEYGFAISDGFDGDGRVLVTNSGEQTHDLSIFRIGESGSYDELLFTVSSGGWVDPTLYLGYGGVSMIDPGVGVVVELHLEPGEYAIACFVPDTGDGRQHLLHGMIQPLTIQE